MDRRCDERSRSGCGRYGRKYDGNSLQWYPNQCPILRLSHRNPGIRAGRYRRHIPRYSVRPARCETLEPDTVEKPVRGIVVSLGERSYRAHIGERFLEEIGE